jgi:hypothetical protein
MFSLAIISISGYNIEKKLSGLYFETNCNDFKPAAREAFQDE